jgi:acyl-coenzyme A synthetase/AMP-(fatty) acid ligase
LYNKANQLARSITNLIKSQDLPSYSYNNWTIGIAMNPSHNLIILMLAIWTSGAAYIVFDIHSSGELMKYIVNEAKPCFVIIGDRVPVYGQFDQTIVYKIGEFLKMSEVFSTEYFLDDESLNYGHNKLAMISYTSGSMTISKGTLLYHDQCQYRLEWQWSKFPFAKDEICIARHSIHHVDHFSEIWAPILNGKTLVIVSEQWRKDIPKICSQIEEYEVKRFTGFPKLISEMISYASEQNILKNVRLWISTGEELTKNIAEKFFNYYTDGTYELVNFYGCTETTGDITYYSLTSMSQLDEYDSIPIGIPFDYSIIYLMNPEKNSFDSGEICIAGNQVAQSYADEVEYENLSRNPFCLLPSFSILFKTGDYGTIRDNLLFFNGRKDRKIRIGEELIDLLEIERIMREIDYVRDCAVLVKENLILGFVSLKESFKFKTVEEISEIVKGRMHPLIELEVIILPDIPYLRGWKVNANFLLQEYEELCRVRKLGTVRVMVDLEDILPEHCEIARKIFTIIGEVIGHALKGIVNKKLNFFVIGGTSQNALEAVADLNEKGFYITIDEFLYAKDLGEILEKVCTKRERTGYSMKFGKEVTVDLITENDKDMCIELLISCYLEKNPLINSMENFEVHKMNQFLFSNWSFFVESELSFKVLDADDKITGVSLNYQIDKNGLQRFTNANLIESIFAYLEFVADNFM